MKKKFAFLLACSLLFSFSDFRQSPGATTIDTSNVAAALGDKNYSIAAARQSEQDAINFWGTSSVPPLTQAVALVTKMTLSVLLYCFAVFMFAKSNRMLSLVKGKRTGLKSLLMLIVVSASIVFTWFHIFYFNGFVITLSAISSCLALFIFLFRLFNIARHLFT